MLLNLGRVPVNSTLYIPFHTFDSNDPSASVTITGLAVTDIEIYKDGSTTQRSSDAGYALLDTDGIDFDGITGIHGFSIDLSDNTDAGFYAADSFYWVVVSAITVDAATINFVAAVFWIGGDGQTLETDTEAILVDSEAIITDTEAVLTDTEAILADTEANVGVLTDTEAILTDAEAILVDTGTTLDTVVDAILVDTEAILVDTGTTLDTNISAILTDTEAAITSRATLLTDTEAILTDSEAVLADTEAAAPVLTDTEAILTDSEAILTDTEAVLADTELFETLSLSGTVDTSTEAATTTTFESDITEATADHFNGRIIIFTSGALIDQATDITDYAFTANSKGKFTFTAVTETPANGTTFRIV